MLQCTQTTTRLPLEQQEQIRQWIMQLDALFAQITPTIPHMQLTSEQSQTLLLAALHAGFFRWFWR